MPASLARLDDEQLFARFRATGDAHALGELFDRTAPALLRVALHLTRDPATAEDLLQETFLRAIEARGEWDAARPLLPWLCGVLHNRARHERWHRGRAPDPRRVTTADAPDPAHEAQRAEFDAAIDAAIAELPEAYRPVLRLHLAYGQPPAAIAHALERPPGTVRSQLARGLEQLRRVLPAGFAGGAAVVLTGLVAGRGLAAVKQSVVAHAHAAVPAVVATGTVLGGVLTMKKLATVAAAAVLAAGVWWCWPRPDDTGPAPEPGVSKPVAAAVPLARDTAAIAPEAEGSTREEAAAQPNAATGSLRIRCRFASDGAAAYGVHLTTTPRLRDGAFAQRSARTGDDGSVLVANLPPVAIDVAAERGGRGTAKVVAGETTDLELVIPAGVLVRGRVIDEHGAPVATAAVWLSEYARNYTDGELVTGVNADGRFELRDVEVERFVSATAPGLRSAAVLPVRPAADNTFDVELVLRGAGVSLFGVVLDADGAPAANARVLIGWRNHSMGWNPQLFGANRPVVSVATDATGAFAAHGLPPGVAQPVWVRSVDHCLWHEQVAMASNRDTSITVRLQRGASLEGRATRADGTAAAGVSIDYVSSAWSRGSPFATDFYGPDWSHRGALTDADGRYRIGCITPGELRLMASTEESHVRGEVEARDGETATWNPVFAPAETAAIRGRVVDERGAPMAGVGVTAYPPRDQGSLGSAQTDADGRFTCARLSAVPHVLKFRAANDNVGAGEIASRWGVLPGTDEVLVQVADAAIPTATLTGRVVASDGTAAVRATVRCSRDGGRYEPEATVDASGAFRVGPLPPGTWRLQVQVQVGESETYRRSAWSEAIALARGETRDVGVLPMPATGSIVVTANGPDGKPLSGFVAIEDSTGWSETAWLVGTLVDGAARIDGVAPGAHRVKVTTKDLPSHYHAVTVVAGQEVRADLRVPKGVCVQLVLSPVSDAVPVHEHFTWHHNGALLHRYDNWWEGNGELTWKEVLAPGDYEVAIVSETGKRSTCAFTIGPDDPPDRSIAIRMP